MIRQTLHEGWHFSATSGPVPDHVAGRRIPARVPGSTHLDLHGAGLIPDPYQHLAEAELTWLHRSGWRYELGVRTTPPAPGERLDLVLEGVDTVADVAVDGRVLGRTANMHRTYRFDARTALGSGRGALSVDLSPALEYAEQREAAMGARPHVNAHPFNAVRKMACSFGWDWGPDLQTAGLWRPVRLERWRTARLDTVRTLVTVEEDGTGRVEVHAAVERDDPGAELRVSAEVAGVRTEAVLPPGSHEAVAVVRVPEVRLWWPAGHGDQPLYPLRVLLHGADGVLDTHERRTGFRTVTVDTAPDEHGTPFTVVVNGRPIFAKGANWIPDDHFLTRITRDRLARRLDQAVGAHMNMLRVWGGGIYESEDFYDLCDERGVLVWQDFPLACAAYAEDAELWHEFEAEAREHVARLTPHPSLALWNGGNENLWGFMDWGWQEPLAGRTWGHGYYTDLFPRVVAELDPTRPYSPGSPASPGHALDAVHPNDQDHGTRHEWQVWNRLDHRAYRDHVPRFCSEFGFQGPPTWRTLTDWVHDDPLTTTSPGFLLHQKAEDGNGKLARGLAPHLPEPASFTDWHWATQLVQARAVAFGVEHFRSWWPRTAGALVWQLNDCWPVTSWSAVDGDGRPKPLLYALRHAFAPRLLTVQPREGRPTLVAVNDTGERWTTRLRVRRMRLDGTVEHESSLDADIAARSAQALELSDPALTPAEAAQEVLVVDDGRTRAVHTFAADRDLAYDPGAVTATAARVPGGYHITATASSFARDTAVLADRLAPDAEADTMLVTLLPGESHTFTVRTDADLDTAALTSAPVLRSVNSLFRP
ncbi:glycoside hydrolase family 2 protein [Nocardiopsis sp. HNM0947]|uniref:beta-mannosidase n=1 Tax=Nocardiopsis coralli TaxID=2772213 RepID=A0ABR9P2V3_9ACTN|nr:glycoside hydrolase family 2 TIM barrel-domain containing protein [Nocardiopsis coralli]MBE2998159.1 glycoside hydrolase family 2 protein [Nocardiopsis coralli]